MTYDNIVTGTFLKRPNRFIAYVEVKGDVKTCHVKNTGRCQELLVPGCTVVLEFHPKAKEMKRKTEYDLIAVYKGNLLINMDSQAPNAAAGEWLRSGGLGEIEDLRPETVHGDSRFDFSFTKNGKQCFLEVKGVTLEEEGICAFPDAPTERGTKHLRGLLEAVKAGYGAYVLFVIQMRPVKCFRPQQERDPAFAKALREAAAGGVEVIAMDCDITPEEMRIREPVPVEL